MKKNHPSAAEATNHFAGLSGTTKVVRFQSPEFFGNLLVP
jgi:hypothetical protein